MKRHHLLICSIAAVLALTACQRHKPLTQEEQATVTKLTENLKTRCVGRYLINVPGDAAVFGTLKVEDVSVEAKAMTLEAYRKALAKRSEEVHATKAWKGYRFLYADAPIDGIADSRYFVTLGDPQTPTDAARLIEAYRWDNGFQIKMMREARNAKDSLYFKDRPEVRDNVLGTTVYDRTHLVISLLNRAQGRADDEIPNEPGVCFPGGWIKGKASEQESVSAQFVPVGHDDVSIDIDTNTKIKTKTALLERGSQIEEAIKQGDGHTVRKGAVALAGMSRPEEWLMGGMTSLGVQGFLFKLEANPKIGDPLTPFISLDVNVGNPNRVLEVYQLDKVSLTEGETLGLWDAVSRTLRPRPNGF